MELSEMRGSKRLNWEKIQNKTLKDETVNKTENTYIILQGILQGKR
jgi:hypothetical protein